MIKELVKDDAILSQRCEKATAEDADVVQDLIDTMESIEECACLAANQIGVTKAIGVYVDEKREPHAIFNPRIMMGLGAQKVFEECMTRDEPSKVTRYAKVKLSYDELVDGELKARKRDFTGWVAQMIQHMCDHCQGKLV
jgi:peptide deformylase